MLSTYSPGDLGIKLGIMCLAPYLPGRKPVHMKGYFGVLSSVDGRTCPRLEEFREG